LACQQGAKATEPVKSGDSRYHRTAFALLVILHEEQASSQDFLSSQFQIGTDLPQHQLK
jgi:hypothetical protein